MLASNKYNEITLCTIDTSTNFSLNHSIGEQVHEAVT